MRIKESGTNGETEQKSDLFKITFWDDILPRCFKRDVFSGSNDEDENNNLSPPETRYYDLRSINP